MKLENEDIVSGRKGAWMQLCSGGRFFPADPRVEEMHAIDIANGLASIKRYGGQGDIAKHYSVAEHSWHMADYLLREGYNHDIVLAALLHDASEAYAGDLIRAVKVAVGNAYADVERGIQMCVWEKYGLGTVVLVHSDIIKDADHRIVPHEKRFLFGDGALSWEFDKFAPLPGVEVEGWSPVEARVMFLDMHDKLCRATGRTVT